MDDYLLIDSFAYNALCICLCFLLNFVASSIGYGKPVGKKNLHMYEHEIIPVTGITRDGYGFFNRYNFTLAGADLS